MYFQATNHDGINWPPVGSMVTINDNGYKSISYISLIISNCLGWLLVKSDWTDIFFTLDCDWQRVCTEEMALTEEVALPTSCFHLATIIVQLPICFSLKQLFKLSILWKSVTSNWDHLICQSINLTQPMYMTVNYSSLQILRRRFADNQEIWI